MTDGARSPVEVEGGCLCGGVRFRVRPPFSRANWCHCSRCRRHSGGPGCVQARVPRERFELLSGDELIEVFGIGEGAVKAFCRACGSSLFGGDWPAGPEVSIRLGAFDEDPGIRPQSHSFVADKAGWYEIADAAPRFEGRLGERRSS